MKKIQANLPAKGLNNLGNTCFFNSAMQCILSMTKFCEIILNKDFSDNQQISRALQNFIINYKIAPNNTVDPKIFINSIKSKIKLFNKTQQDAHAFLEMLLSIIFEENKTIKNKQGELEQLFLVEHEDSVICKSCMFKVTNTVKSHIQWLFVNESIENSFIKYEEIEDMVDKSSQWHCYNCNRNVLAGIKHKIINSSTYLIVHLNRFLDIQQKNNANIIVNETIKINKTPYKLIGEVCHTGTLSYGHYYAYASRNNKFYKFDDSIASSSFPLTNSSTPYILFYEKI